ncbi:MAG: thioredoxin fold domain-containing protein [Chitinophagaceae bacterium]|jgi:thioredoxin|nr:thioredoxin fold domain-containing protein [Chitinophagaceae bacterium]MCA6495242.1 thioredoxin fold domain-containing protein [Chitinophagaceae bacterium]
MKCILSVLFSLAVYTVTAQYGVIGIQEFRRQLATGKYQLLDVRTAGEYKQVHMSNALQADWTKEEEFAERVKYLDKNKPVLIYCASGGRSGQAGQWMVQQGFTKVDNLAGGMIAWKQAGLPTISEEGLPSMTMQEYKRIIQAAPVVLVDFGAEWCPPCKKMEPVLADLQNELKGKFMLVKVDGGKDTEVLQANKVSSLPVFVVYKNGKETFRGQGVLKKEELKARLQ